MYEVHLQQRHHCRHTAAVLAALPSSLSLSLSLRASRSHSSRYGPRWPRLRLTHDRPQPPSRCEASSRRRRAWHERAASAGAVPRRAASRASVRGGAGPARGTRCCCARASAIMAYIDMYTSVHNNRPIFDSAGHGPWYRTIRTWGHGQAHGRRAQAGRMAVTNSLRSHQEGA
jgi:hypothetical protein